MILRWVNIGDILRYYFCYNKTIFMEIAIVGLLLIIAAQMIYIVYTDRENRAERERMQLKIMSKDVTEYKEAIAPPDHDTPEQTDAYLPLEDVDIERLAQAKDNT